MSDPAGRPVLRVIHGDATPEEVAAVLAVVLARSRAARRATEQQTGASLWGSARHRSVRVSPSGRHVDAAMLSWRTSFWPR